MMKIRHLFTAAALCLAGSLLAAPDASAASATVQADGALHLYKGFNRTSQCGAFPGDREGINSYESCFEAEASLWNNGFCNDRYPDVWVYADALMYGPARRGVYCGVAINDLRQYKFDAGTGKYAGLPLYHHIGALTWTKLPR